MSEEHNVRSKMTSVELVLGVLAVLSVILLLIPTDLIKFHKTLIASDYDAHLYKDNGLSEIRWLDQEKQLWECVLNDQHITPFCSMQLDIIDEHGKGINLSDYDSMTIWLNYTGEAEHLRVYLRNRNPQYFVLGDITSTKYNVVEVPVSQLKDGLVIDMNNINVADWWLSSHKIPLQLSRPEFEDVVYLEIQTGSQSREGVHQIQLEKVEWQGAWLTQAALYKIIILVWIMFIFAILIYRIVALNIQLKNNQRYQKELISINDFLNLKNKKFEDLAKTDPLTGLHNRLGIRDALYEGLNNWKNQRQPFSFVLIDIDHFKRLNDTYGHDMGDKVLQLTALQLGKNIRRTDFLARWGGEEFILVCPNTTLDEAEVVAEFLRDKIEHMDIDSDHAITASFGVSSMSEPDLKKLFKSADDALYQAKEQGRNRVVTSI
ncbi:GGDEF domain-containing protein [Paraglaciecola hydrolytica]|uniref:diguanylate cyclase n=1 Tax=Paraglaciecola hydrolytica TaxID=1799789 RepID=A0A135ZYI2_9ALTE|nr:GGDEF domain-containing protein [Paraglaciecola hydrolytica]KXI28042.1 diguanylate cyclase [Paraglaciecola hydrolytica]